MKKLLFLFGLLITAIASFGQANTVSAKTISATQAVYVRSARVDSISSDGTFTNGNANVLVTQSAVKSYVSPVKLRADSLANGLFLDTTKLNYLGPTRTFYSSSNGKMLFDKGFGVGDAYVYTHNDSINYITFKKVINAGSCTNCNISYDSAGRVLTASNGSSSGGGVAKKTINIQNTNYTLLATDTSTYITVSRTANDTIYVPDDGTVTMSAPVNLDIYQLGTGKVIFLPLNGNIVVNAEFGKNRSGQQYSKVTLNKLSSNNWVLSGQLDTASVPYLTTNINTLPAQTTNSGTPSTLDSVSVSGFFLTAGGVVQASAANWQISTDGSTWINYPSTISLTQSGTGLAGQPVKIYERISASASSGNISGTINFSSAGANTMQIPITGTVNTVTQQAYFNFAATRTTAAGSQPVYGDPTLSPVFADSVNGTMWTVSLIGANWIKYGGFYGGSGNGANAGSTDGIFTQAMGASNLYTQTPFSSSSPNYNLIIGNNGELAAGTYQIVIWGSIPYNTFINGVSEYWVQFGSGSTSNVAVVNPNGQTPGAGTVNLQTAGPGSTNLFNGSFTGTITSGQSIKICISKGTGGSNTPPTGGAGQLGVINAIFIKKIS